MNDFTLLRKNLFRNPVRAALLLVCIFIAFFVLCISVGFSRAITAFNTLPTRMVTLSKINYTETLPLAYYDRISRMDDVAAATHVSWFGGYYREPINALTVYAIEPESYLRIYAEDLPLSPLQRAAFLSDRGAMFVAEPIARRFGWREGQRVPLNSNIFSQMNGSQTWDFVIAGIVPSRAGSSQNNAILIHYNYFNDTISFGRDRIGWVAFLTTSATVNDRVAAAIDARFANSADETSTQDEATFNAAFASQLGDTSLVVTLLVSASFVAILLIVGTTMAVSVRARTKEIGVLKMMGFSSLRILSMIVGEALFLSFLGAGLGIAASAGVLGTVLPAADLPPVGLTAGTMGLAALAALGLGLFAGIPPALAAWRMPVVAALGRD